MVRSCPESPTSTLPAGEELRLEGAQRVAEWGLLSLAVLLGLLRFWKLGEWSFWVDEAYTFADARFGLDSDQLWNPLGYRLLISTAEWLAERPDEFGLRFLPALVGWLCIPLTWWAFRCWVGGRRAALVALLLAISSWHIFWSQNARFYTLAMGTSLLGSGLVLRGYLGGKRPLALVGILIAGAAAAFHVTAALIVPGLVLAPLLAKLRGLELPTGFRSVWKWLLLTLAIGALASTPFLLSALENHTDEKGTLSWLQGPVHLSKTLAYFFTPMIWAAAVVGSLWALVRKDQAGLFAVGLVAMVVAAALLVSTQVLMTAQYTFCILPWVLLLAVLPLESLAKSAQGRGLFWAGTLVFVAPALTSTLLYFTSRMGERPRWRDAYTFVDDRREAGDLILGMGSSVGEFYLGGDNPDPRRPRTVSPLGDWHPEGPRRWNRHDRRVWVVIRPQWLEGLAPEDELTLTTWLASDCQLVKRFPALMEGRDLELLVYLRE
ncbi:MAG: mannosyltransferase [Candidatus Paceibacteria bacterium]|jgi:mannosyltransferase